MAKRAKPNGTGKSRGRKSKAESMTGAKESAVETRSGELELKRIEIPSKDFHFHMKAIKAAMEKKDTAVSLLRSAKKGAEQLHKGLVATIDKMIRLERADSDQELRQELELLGIALRETGSPIQLTIHDALLGDVKDVARKRGKKAALAGDFSDNPYPAGSDLQAEYAAGYEAGVA